MCCMILSVQIVQGRQMHRDRKQTVGQGWGEGWQWLVGTGAFFGERKMFGTGGCGEMPDTLTVLRATEVFTLKW